MDLPLTLFLLMALLRSLSPASVSAVTGRRFACLWACESTAVVGVFGWAGRRVWVSAVGGVAGMNAKG